MIWPVFTNKTIRKLLPIFLIILVGTFLRFNKINQAFPFDFDQEAPAAAAYDFFINHKITLIGQELSFKGFFLGPLHNWIQFVPYGICNLKPDCVPYFYILIGILTIIVFYLVVKKIFDTKTATIASAIYAMSFSAISFEREVNSNYFLFLSSIGLLFCLYKYFLEENKFLIFGAFIAGLAVINFNPVFIFSAIAFFITALLRRNKNISTFVIALFAFLVNYLPLIIFNFRHNNILVDNFQKFLSQNTNSSDYIRNLIYLTKNVMLPFLTNYFFQSANLFFLIPITFFLILGLYKIVKIQDQFTKFLPIWIVTTLLGLVFYKGWVPDYYFQQILLPLIIIISFVIRKNLTIFLIFISIFLFVNIQRNVNYKTIINYNVKKDAVKYVISDSQGETFNVYYQLPLAINTGYPFLFKIFGGVPLEGGKNLYIFEFRDPSYYLKLKYQQAFPSKTVSTGFDKYVKIISIKNVN